MWQDGGGGRNQTAIVQAAEIDAWTLRAGLDGAGVASLLEGYCARLVKAGVPLWRVAIGADTLHPLIEATGHRWVSGQGVSADILYRVTAAERDAEWRRSPWYRLLLTEEIELRRRLFRGEGVEEFPLLEELVASGATDYWACIVRDGGNGFGETRGLVTSWTTRAAAGFDGRHLELIAATLPAFALACRMVAATDTARTLLSTYLGQDAAERILRGEIERGRVRPLRRVLWFSDLVGFTRLADTLPHEQLLDLLNAYADSVVATLQAFGGEILKFMGDGVLAVFDGPAEDGCSRALDAAAAVRDAVARLNRERGERGLATTEVTIALHEGEVLSGNIGSRERLDFTIVGPAVNEVHRIQAMSRSLDQPVLISAAFADNCQAQRDRLVSVGRFALRGVHRPQELFTVDLTAGHAPAP